MAPVPSGTEKDIFLGYGNIVGFLIAVHVVAFLFWLYLLARALVAILLVVHFVAIGFIVYLFLRSAEATPAAKRRVVKGREMEMQHNVQPPPARPIRCVADGPSAAVLWQR
ncbi:g10876 [Coccomyxa elongata]